jgi:uncharacterized protein YyaL (SSP411 family)
MSTPDFASNRLAGASSPYLRQHAGNPVHWQPWEDATLARARATDTPILLSIGYSACHWCHVMAHECFEDPAIAAAMNAAFVNIKLDREERPDIDQAYQLAHQAFNGRGGGWPLTVFLDPQSLAPFYVGTYFPPTPRHGLPAFPEVLQQVRARISPRTVANCAHRQGSCASGCSTRNRVPRAQFPAWAPPTPAPRSASPSALIRATAATRARPSFRVRLNWNGYLTYAATTTPARWPA